MQPPEQASVNPKVKPFLEEDQPPRILGLKQLFVALRLLCVHPIIWNGDGFVPSGSIPVCLLYASALISLGYAVMNVWNLITCQTLFKFGGYTLGSDMDTFMTALSAGTYATGSLLAVAFVRCRAQIAIASNELHSLWLTSGRPRQKMPLAAFTYFLWSPCSIALSLCEILRLCDLVRPTDPLFALTVGDILNFSFVMNLVSVVFVLMIFVYGTLIECLQSLLDSLRAPFEGDRCRESAVWETVSCLERLLDSFSSAVSPLIALGCITSTCPLLQLMFSVIVRGRQAGSVAQSVISCGLGALFCIALVLSHLLATRVSEARHLLREQFNSNEVLPVTFRKLDYKLEKLPHPVRVFTVFKFDVRLGLSMMIFFLNFYMTFIQLKAIMIGNGTNGT